MVQRKSPAWGCQVLYTNIPGVKILFTTPSKRQGPRLREVRKEREKQNKRKGGRKVHKKTTTTTKKAWTMGPKRKKKDDSPEMETPPTKKGKAATNKATTRSGGKPASTPRRLYGNKNINGPQGDLMKSPPALPVASAGRPTEAATLPTASRDTTGNKAEMVSATDTTSVKKVSTIPDHVVELLQPKHHASSSTGASSQSGASPQPGASSQPGSDET